MSLDSEGVLFKISGSSRAGIAQLVERNLAKVEVASSSLVSRSKLFGVVAEWSRSGLQIRVRRFDSGRRLQDFPS